MSSLDAMIKQLNEAIEAKRQQDGAVSKPVATVESEESKGEAARHASEELSRFLTTAANSIQRKEAEQNRDDETLTAALSQFVGQSIVRQALAPTGTLDLSKRPPATGSHGHKAHGHGGHGHGSGHSGAGHGGHGGHGGGQASQGSTTGGALQAPPAEPMICVSCASQIKPNSGAIPAAAATAASLAAPPTPPAPVAPPPQPAAPATPPSPLATNFAWKKHISAVEAAIRNKEVALAESLLKVLNEVAEVIEIDVAARLRMATQLSNIRIERGEIEAAQKALVQALQSIQGTEHKKSVATAFCLDALAQCYQVQEKFDDAEKSRRAAVVIAEEALGAEHPDSAYFRERLETMRQDRAIAMIGCDEASKTILDKLSDEYNAAAAAGTPVQAAESKPADSVSGFMFDKYLQNGKNALAQKNLREAESCLRSAVEKGQGLADSDPRKSEGLRLLASTLDLQNKQPEAKQLYEQSLTLAFKFIGWNDVQVAHNLAALAELHHKMNDLGIAKNYYKQAIASYTCLVGKEHETVVALQKTYDAFLEKLKEERKWKGWSA